MDQRPPEHISAARQGLEDRPEWIGYAAAVLLQGLFLLLLHVTHLHLPVARFPVLYAGVPLAVAYFWGLGPWFVAFLVSSGMLAYYFAPPADSFRVAPPTIDTWAGLAAYVVSSLGGLIAVLLLRRFYRKLLAEMQERRLIQERLAHARDDAENDRARFEAVIDSMHEGLIFADTSGLLTYWNPAAISMHQYQTLEEVRKHVSQFTENFELRSPDGRPIGLDQWPLPRILRGESFSDWDVIVTRTDTGMTRVLSYSGTPVRNSAGEITLAVLTISDITERKRIEEEIRQRAEEVETVMDVAPVAIWIGHDPETREITGNRMANQFYEAEPGENVSANVVPVRRFFRNGRELAPDGLPMQEAAAKNIDVRGVELDVLLPSGKWLAMLGSASPLRDAEGRVRGSVGVFMDITERKRAQEKQAELASLLDLAHVIVMDPEYRITYWSMGDERLYGYTREEALGRVTSELLRTQTTLHVDDMHEQLRRDGHWSGELRQVRRDGKLIYVASHQVLFRDANGKPSAVLEVNNDITEQKRVEEEFRRLNAELEQRVAERTSELRLANQGLVVANKELEAFSYSVSHDLRAPLRAVDGFSNALQKSFGEQLGERGADYLRRIRAAAQRMGELIDDLLGLSRATRMEVKREQIDLSDMVRELAEDLQRSGPDRGVEFVVQPGVQVSADKHLMQIAMRNLLDNAWKFTSTRDEARIEFGVCDQDGVQVYYVSDNGVGFDPAYAGKLFTPFQRLHTESEFPGTGIGLALVQRVISKHGGRIWAEGSVDGGATFSFTLG